MNVPQLASSAGGEDALYLGLDVGTSGVRAVLVDGTRRLHAQAGVPLAASRVDGALVRQSPQDWWRAVQGCLQQALAHVDAGRVRALAVDGTSGTVLCVDEAGQPLSEGWMYNDASCAEQAAQVARHAPADSPARGASSPLARMLRLQALHPDATWLLHQADWIAGCLAERFGFSDDNNVLKLGYDLQADRWPAWMDKLGVRRDWLPTVGRPGTAVAPVAPAIASQFALAAHTQVVRGTTDGVASFLATGASEVGDAVTALGSTLVVKVLSAVPVLAPEFGIYSHRLGALWLPGGASNSGGAALLRHLSLEQMQRLTPLLRTDEPTGLDYYPLQAVGERFPVNDAQQADRSTPRPADDLQFFQGLLEGIAGVERLAFERIAALGAPYPGRVFSVGGGARNAAWTRMRGQRLGVPMCTPAHEDAAYGSALLALAGVKEGAA